MSLEKLLATGMDVCPTFSETSSLLQISIWFSVKRRTRDLVTPLSSTFLLDWISFSGRTRDGVDEERSEGIKNLSSRVIIYLKSNPLSLLGSSRKYFYRRLEFLILTSIVCVSCYFFIVRMVKFEFSSPFRNYRYNNTLSLSLYRRLLERPWSVLLPKGCVHDRLKKNSRT